MFCSDGGFVGGRGTNLDDFDALLCEGEGGRLGGVSSYATVGSLVVCKENLGFSRRNCGVPDFEFLSDCRVGEEGSDYRAALVSGCTKDGDEFGHGEEMGW